MKAVILAGFMVFALAGCNNATEEAATEIEERVTAADVAPAVVATSADNNIKVPSDMSDEAQDEMMGLLATYNGCMKENRAEYHKPGANAEELGTATMARCEVSLTELKALLDSNGVMSAFTAGMMKKFRNKAARKLMGSLMNSQVQREVDAEAAAVTQ